MLRIRTLIGPDFNHRPACRRGLRIGASSQAIFKAENGGPEEAIGKCCDTDRKYDPQGYSKDPGIGHGV